MKRLILQPLCDKEENKMSKKVMFLFGAGAEITYNLKSGPDYTKDTILTKKKNLYNALSKFYSTRLTNDKYVSVYKKEYLFRNNSSAYTDMIHQAVGQLMDKKDNKKLKCFAELFNNYSPVNDEINDAFKVEAKKIYYNIIAEEKCYEYKDAYKELFEKMVFLGTIEKDFAGIIAPAKIGLTHFWRLINYFWSAYFSILIPILSKEKNEIITTARYTELLDNLKENIEYIYSDKFIDEYEVSDIKQDYYTIFKETLNGSNIEYCAATTNYTPFIRKFTEDKNISFLAGELRTFEDPTKFEVKRITVDPFGENDFIFPYIMTQAPIKPIICTYQIEEYAKFVNNLHDSDYLVIVGYSLGEGDNHINAMIRDYYKKGEKKIIFCKYSNTNIEDYKKEKDDLIKKLKLENEKNTERIIIVTHNGKDAKSLIEDIISKM